MTALTTTRASLMLDLARRHAGMLDIDVAITIVDDRGDLLCCARSDNMPVGNLNLTYWTARSAARNGLGRARRTLSVYTAVGGSPHRRSRPATPSWKTGHPPQTK